MATNEAPIIRTLMTDTTSAASLPPAALPTTPDDEVPWFAQSFESSGFETSGFQESTVADAVVSVAVPSAPVTASAPLVETTPTQAASFDRAKVRPLLEIEREVVDYALRAFGGNVAQAARALQVNPSTLYRKIQVWTAAGEPTKVVPGAQR